MTITLFVAPEMKAEREAMFQQDPSVGWNDFTEQAVETILVPGNHFTMLTPPHVQILAERLSVCLGIAMKPALEQRKTIDN